MNDASKYIRLFGMLLLTAVSFITGVLLLFFVIKLVFGFLNNLPWFTIVYSVFVLSVPAAIFIGAYTIFFRRLKNQTAKSVKIFSAIIFIAFIVAWLFYYIADLLAFVKTGKVDIVETHSWNLLLIVASIAALFLTGIVHALNSPKENDWLDKHNSKEV
ncbi:MAG: hypothetical protein ABIO05_01760 [Ferruginibacter sp.]